MEMKKLDISHGIKNSHGILICSSYLDILMNLGWFKYNWTSTFIPCKSVHTTNVFVDHTLFRIKIFQKQNSLPFIKLKNKTKLLSAEANSTLSRKRFESYPVQIHHRRPNNPTESNNNLNIHQFVAWRLMRLLYPKCHSFLYAKIRSY